MLNVKLNNISYFLERVAKGIWLFLPMAIALMINFGVFATVIHALWMKNRAMRTLNQGNHKLQAKSKKDDGFMSQYVNKNNPLIIFY